RIRTLSGLEPSEFHTVIPSKLVPFFGLGKSISDRLSLPQRPDQPRCDGKMGVFQFHKLDTGARRGGSHARTFQTLLLDETPPCSVLGARGLGSYLRESLRWAAKVPTSSSQGPCHVEPRIG